MTAPYLLERCAGQEARRSDLLSAAEKAAAQALRTPKRRRDWLTGRVAAKRLVAAWLAENNLLIGPENIEILNDKDGVPYVRLPSELKTAAPRISISHSASGGVAALRKGPIGVDLEIAVDRPASFLPIMMHESEHTPGIESDPAEQTRLWTVKEAVSKLLGLGLSVDLWDIRHIPAPDSISERPVPGRSPRVPRRLELHGKARERWQAMGGPEIRIDTFTAPNEVLTIAYTPGETHA